MKWKPIPQSKWENIVDLTGTGPRGKNTHGVGHRDPGELYRPRTRKLVRKYAKNLLREMHGQDRSAKLNNIRRKLWGQIPGSGLAEEDFLMTANSPRKVVKQLKHAKKSGYY